MSIATTKPAGVCIGYARCSTDKQDLAAQHAVLLELGVDEDRIYLDHGLTGTNRDRPGLDQAPAAVDAGDTLVVPKLDPPKPLLTDWDEGYDYVPKTLRCPRKRPVGFALTCRPSRFEGEWAVVFK